MARQSGHVRPGAPLWGSPCLAPQMTVRHQEQVTRSPQQQDLPAVVAAPIRVALVLGAVLQPTLALAQAPLAMATQSVDHLTRWCHLDLLAGSVASEANCLDLLSHILLPVLSPLRSGSDSS